jgi:O-antigen/teichoic acid export membrane protein
VNTAFRILKNSIALWLAMLLERLFSIVLIIFIARDLGVSSLGEYTLVLSLFAIFQILALLGQDEIIMREVARDTSRASLYLVNSGLVAVFTAFVFSVVMNVTASLLGYAQDIIIYVYVASVALIPGTLTLIAEAVVKALEKMEYVTAVRFCGSLLYVGASLVGLRLGYGLVVVFAFISVIQVAMFILYIYTITRLAGRLSFQIDLRFCRSLLHISGPFFLINVFGMVSKKIDVIALSKLTSSEAVGIYAAASKLAQAGQMVSAAYTTSIVPSMSQAFVTSKERFKRIAEQSAKMYLIVAFPTAFGVTILADKLIFLLFGSEYSSSVAVLRILIWTLVLLAVNSVLFRTLIASNNETISVRVAAVRMVGGLVLSLLLIPRYGVIGAAIASIGTVLLGLVLNYYFVSRVLFKIDFARIAGRPFVCAVIASGALIWFHRATSVVLLLFGIALYACLYLILLVVLRALSPEELLLLHQLWRRVVAGERPAALE